MPVYDYQSSGQTTRNKTRLDAKLDFQSERSGNLQRSSPSSPARSAGNGQTIDMVKGKDGVYSASRKTLGGSAARNLLRGASRLHPLLWAAAMLYEINEARKDILRFAGREEFHVPAGWRKYRDGCGHSEYLNSKMSHETIVEWVRFKHLVERGLESGHLKHGITMKWDAYGSCTEPASVYLRSAPPPAGAVAEKIDASRHARWIQVGVRCRRCDACKNAKAFFWQERATREMALATRTWFCTFTYRPEERLKVYINARRRSGKEDFSSLSKMVQADFTKYLKRLRKNSGVKFRYLLAIEPHKDGFPHMHALLHEASETPLLKREIQAAWPYGFTHVKLADPKHTRYVVKYISKTEQARVRASLRYGTTALAIGD